MNAEPGADRASTTVDVHGLRPFGRWEAVALAEAETARMVTLLRSLTPAGWARPTDCPAWDVRALAGHVLGMTETFSGLPRFVRMMTAGGRAAGDGPFIDGLTAVQVRVNAGLCTAGLVERLAVAGPRQARWRGSRRLLRAVPSNEHLPDGTTERWRMAFILDTILTRDTWMHRVDVARATDRPLELTAAHDGRIVADVVREWADRHGRPFGLRLTGPAGGTYTGGGGGTETPTLDAVEFCRILSGRAPGEGLLGQWVPF